jgi:hypothetical protein
MEAGLRWVALAVAVLCLASAFAPMTREFTRGLRWVMCAFALLEAGISLGRSRRGAFLAYAAIAVLANPIRPYSFAPEFWRLFVAGAGLWLIADQLPQRPAG